MSSSPFVYGAGGRDLGNKEFYQISDIRQVVGIKPVVFLFLTWPTY